MKFEIRTYWLFKFNYEIFLGKIVESMSQKYHYLNFWWYFPRFFWKLMIGIGLWVVSMYHERYHISKIKYLLELVLKRKKRKSVTKHVFHASTSFLKRETVHPGQIYFQYLRQNIFLERIYFALLTISKTGIWSWKRPWSWKLTCWSWARLGDLIWPDLT